MCESKRLKAAHQQKKKVLFCLLNMDDADTIAILDLQLQDIEEILRAERDARFRGQPRPAWLPAMLLQRQELQRDLEIVKDRQISLSMQRAVRQDANAIAAISAQERLAQSDRAFACRLAGVPVPVFQQDDPTPPQTPRSSNPNGLASMSATNRGDERGILQQIHYPDQPGLAFATPQSGLPPSTPTIAAQSRTSLLNSALAPSPENGCNNLSNPLEQFLKSTRPNDITPQVEMPSKISKAQNPVPISKAPRDNSLIYSNATPKPYITKPSTIVSAAIDQSTGKQKITSKPGRDI